MAAKIYPFKGRKEMKENGNQLALALTTIAWVLLAIGIILCLFRLSDFNDRNIYLMLGIYCVAASIIVYCIGGFLLAAQTKLFRKAHDDVASKRKH
jgi:fucose permease